LGYGQSIGMRLAGIAVVDAKSLQPCTGLQAVQRNRLAANTFGWILSLVVVIARGRRGFYEETIVVSTRALAATRRR
jgi:uncharacterized RDD family membrane protein YckC